MEDKKNEKKIAHLTLIQSIITRMASNLFYLRGWVITLISGVLVLLTQITIAKMPIIFLLGVIIIFWSYDGYFLSLERSFRDLYDKIRGKEESQIDFSMKFDEEILGRKKNSVIFCMLSPTLRYFYGPLVMISLYVIFFFK